ncbi:glycosyltransferase family 4 protein [Knoellia sp. CPCC 206435]|uniref:glycosyltransferase family 4 protein n=1 Tax=Knoellia terrae TaxID=3404797 RepID=UPI003B43D0F3
MSALHVVVPDGVDDPRRPSGGNTYDRRVCTGLRDRGWVVRRREVAGPWPGPDPVSRAALRSTLASIPDGAVVLLDGLVTSAVPEVVVPEGRRLRLVVLVHLPLGHGSGTRGDGARGERERAALGAAHHVVATSGWTRDWLVDAYSLSPSRVSVVAPGADPAAVVQGSAGGGRLLCVGAVTATKGHDVLVDALGELADLDWSCRCVGAVTVDGPFADGIRAKALTGPVGARIAMPGPRVGPALDAEYAAADLVLAPSRTETYGMTVTEALARGVPVLGSRVGGLPEAMGTSPEGQVPGLLVRAGDAGALAGALRTWLTDAGLRNRLRSVALGRRATLSDWSETTAGLDRVLSEVAA